MRSLMRVSSVEIAASPLGASRRRENDGGRTGSVHRRTATVEGRIGLQRTGLGRNPKVHRPVGTHLASHFPSIVYVRGYQREQSLDTVRRAPSPRRARTASPDPVGVPQGAGRGRARTRPRRRSKPCVRCMPGSSRPRWRTCREPRARDLAARARAPRGDHPPRRGRHAARPRTSPPPASRSTRWPRSSTVSGTGSACTSPSCATRSPRPRCCSSRYPTSPRSAPPARAAPPA